MIQSFLDWWSALGQANQVLLISTGLALVGNVFVVAIGFVVTYMTSIQANKRISELAAETTAQQIRSLNVQKLADYRIKWIEDLRECTSLLYRLHYESSLLKNDIRKNSESEEKAALKVKLREVNTQITQTKRNIVLRINPDTTEENEKRLLDLLRKRVPPEFEEAKKIRKEIEKVINTILRAEWRRLNVELGLRETEQAK